MSEWDSIIGIGKTQHSYGTCVRTAQKHPSMYGLSKYYLEANDTLQGIALKHSTTVSVDYLYV